MDNEKNANEQVIDAEPSNRSRQPKIGYYWHVRDLEAKDKQVIAKEIVQNRIEPSRGAAVFIDTGSTCEAVAKEILRFQKCNASLDLTILTNNMAVFGLWQQASNEISETSLLILTGGEYDRYHNALFGNEAKESIERFHPEIIIMGTSGLCFDEKINGGGLHCHAGTQEEVIKEALINKRTQLRIIACDYMKIGRSHAYTVCEPKELAYNCKICVIITTLPPENDKEAMEIFNKEVEKFKKLVNTLETERKGESLQGRLELVALNTETGKVEIIVPETPERSASKNKSDS